MNLLETSIAARLLHRFNAAYSNSLIRAGIEKSFCQIKICLRYSFFYRISEIDAGVKSKILRNSKLLRWPINTYDIWKGKTANYANSSIIMSYAAKVKKRLYFSPVMTASLFFSIAVLTDALLSALWSRTISALGWFIRGIILFVGFYGVFCRVDWEELRKTSYFIRWIERNKQ